MGQLVNLDGVIAPTASVSILDRGFLYGDSIYEVVWTFAGKLFGLQEHLDRLRQSAAYLYLDVPWSDAHIQTEIERTLQQAGNSESYIRIIVTRGVQQEIALLPSQDLQPHLAIVVKPISPQPVLPQGIHLRVVSRQRLDQLALNPAAKTGNYLNSILALLEARQSGADDALMLNSQGELTEATTSNLWLISQGVVRTPAVEAGILHGITRYFLLKLLRQMGIPDEEVSLKTEDIWSAEEAFLSSSVRLLVPVKRIDDYTLPKCPGLMTCTLWQGLLDLMQEHCARQG